MTRPVSLRTFEVWRGDAAGGDLVEYAIEAQEGMVVLDAMREIQRTQAHDLAVRWNCKAAKCGCCAAEVDGRPRLMCKTRLGDFPEGEVIRVEPMRAFPIVRDLVTDVSWNYAVDRMIPPFTPKQDAEWLVQQADVDRMSEFRKCIECFLCQDVCHVLREHDLKARYFGPRFMVRIASLEMHPLDAPRPHGAPAGRGGRRLLQHHEVLQRRVPRGDQHHGQRDHPAQGAGGRPLVRSAGEARAEAPASARRLTARPGDAGAGAAAVQVASRFGWRRSTMSSSSAAAAPECAPRSRHSTRERTSRSSRSCIPRGATPVRPRAGSTPRSAMPRRTAPRSTPSTPSRAPTTSATRTRSRSSARRRRATSTSSSAGEPSSPERPMDASRSVRSAPRASPGPRTPQTSRATS